MDGLLGLILAILVFVVIILLVSRSIKTIILLGVCIGVFLVLAYMGVLG
ncbi:MAG: hypothetical protein KKE24_00065 [Candidatus Thermoplasmatota archaeon]|nr:hypothetical protein [Candidatus Thermoplasmatota archaeon]